MFSYAFVLLNDLFTAGNGIVIKQKLDTKDLGKNGLLFYNCLFMIPPAIIVFFITEDLSRIIGTHFTLKCSPIILGKSSVMKKTVIAGGIMKRQL